MLAILSNLFKDNSDDEPLAVPVRWLPVQYHDMGLPEGRPVTVRFQAFDERALARSHPRHLDNHGDVSLTLDEVAAVAAGAPAAAHAELPATVAYAALQTVLERSREPVPRFMGAHALGEEAERTAFVQTCAARGVLLRDPGVRVEMAAPVA
jgi:hypothetical protein